MATLTGPTSLRARGRTSLNLLFHSGIRAPELPDIRLCDQDLRTGILGGRGNGSQRQRDEWRTVGIGELAQRAAQQHAFCHRPPYLRGGPSEVVLVEGVSREEPLVALAAGTWRTKVETADARIDLA